MENSTSIYTILGYISAFSTLIPFIFGIVFYRNSETTLRIATILFGLGLFTEIFCRIYATFINPNNIWLFNVYQLIETILISAIYYTWFKNKLLRYALLIFCSLFIVIAVNEQISSGTKTLNSLSLSIESIAVILFSFITFFLFLKESLQVNILSVPFFWFNTAFLIYFTCNIFLHLFSQYLQEHALYTFYELWGLWHSLSNITFYTLISIGFWKTRKSQI